MVVSLIFDDNSGAEASLRPQRAVHRTYVRTRWSLRTWYSFSHEYYEIQYRRQRRIIQSVTAKISDLGRIPVANTAVVCLT